MLLIYVILVVILLEFDWLKLFIWPIQVVFGREGVKGFILGGGSVVYKLRKGLNISNIELQESGVGVSFTFVNNRAKVPATLKGR